MCRRKCRCNLGMNAAKGVHDQRIVHRSTPFEQDSQRFLVGESWSVGTIRDEGVKTINDGKDASSDRNRFMFQSVRVSAPVPLFVVRQNNRNDWVRELNAVEDFRTDDWMNFHSIEFFGREASGFREDLFRYGELAYIVKHGRCAQGV